MRKTLISRKLKGKRQEGIIIENRENREERKRTNSSRKDVVFERKQVRLKPVYQVTRFVRINHADETGFRPFNFDLTCGLRPRLAARFTLKRANKFDTNDVRPRPHRPPRLVFRFVTVKVSRVPFYVAGEV